MRQRCKTCSTFEAALAARRGRDRRDPKRAAEPIAKACKADAFDLAALAEAATRSGNLAIPLVKALTAHVAKSDADAARYVHWGATSQDVIDTAAMLSLRAALMRCLATSIAPSRALPTWRGGTGTTAMVARTWLQHALPMRSASSLPNMPRPCTARRRA